MFGELNNLKTGIQEIKVTDSNRSYFKGTLAVIIVYGALVAAILIMSLVPSLSKYFTEDFYPFTMTFMFGIIFVIILLLYTIYITQAPVPEVKPQDIDMTQANYRCPDFYTYNVDTNTCEKPAMFPERKFTPGTGDKVAVTIDRTSGDQTINYDFSNLNVSFRGFVASNLNSNISCDTVDLNKLTEFTALTSSSNVNPANVYCGYADLCGVSWSKYLCNGGSSIAGAP